MAECELSCAKYWVFFFNLVFAVSIFSELISMQQSEMRNEKISVRCLTFNFRNLNFFACILFVISCLSIFRIYCFFCWYAFSWVDWQYWLLAASLNMRITIMPISSAILGIRHQYWWWPSAALFSLLRSSGVAEQSRKAHAWFSV